MAGHLPVPLRPFPGLRPGLPGRGGAAGRPGGAPAGAGFVCGDPVECLFFLLAPFIIDQKGTLKDTHIWAKLYPFAVFLCVCVCCFCC